MPPTWRIYYDTGATFSSEDGAPEEAPNMGFICVVGYTLEGARYITHGFNHYRWDPPTAVWWGMDWHGVLDRLRFTGAERDNPFFAYKEGRMVSDVLFKDLMTRAHRDPDFPMR